MRYYLTALLVTLANTALATPSTWTQALDSLAQSGQICELRGPQFSDLYLSWMSEEPFALIDSNWQNRARRINFYPLPRGVLSRKLRQYQSASDKQLSVGLSGLQTLGFLIVNEIDDCSLKKHLVQQLQLDTERWDAAKSQLTTKQQYLALVNGIEVNTRVRVLTISEGLVQNPAYVAEGFVAGLESQAFLESMNALMNLEQSLSGGIPYPKLDDQRSRIRDDITHTLAKKHLTAFHMEVLSQRINEYRTTIEETIGNSLGLTTGFNSLDGD